MKTFPIIPITIEKDIQKIITRFCPLSRTEIVDDMASEKGSKIFKFVGLADLDELEKCIPSRFVPRYRTKTMALYEGVRRETTAIFMNDGVLVIMISSTNDQHEGVMNYYSDIALLLSQVGNDDLISMLWRELEDAREKAEVKKRDELIEKIRARGWQPSDVEPIERSEINKFERGKYDEIDEEKFFGIALYLADPGLIKVIEDEEEYKGVEIDDDVDDKIETLERCWLRYFKNGDYDLIDPYEYFSIALYLKNPALVEIQQDLLDQRKERGEDIPEDEE